MAARTIRPGPQPMSSSGSGGPASTSRSVASASALQRPASIGAAAGSCGVLPRRYSTADSSCSAAAYGSVPPEPKVGLWSRPGRPESRVIGATSLSRRAPNPASAAANRPCGARPATSVGVLDVIHVGEGRQQPHPQPRVAEPGELAGAGVALATSARPGSGRRRGGAARAPRIHRRRQDRTRRRRRRASPRTAARDRRPRPAGCPCRSAAAGSLQPSKIAPRRSSRPPATWGTTSNRPRPRAPRHRRRRAPAGWRAARRRRRACRRGWRRRAPRPAPRLSGGCSRVFTLPGRHSLAMTIRVVIGWPPCRRRDMSVMAVRVPRTVPVTLLRPTRGAYGVSTSRMRQPRRRRLRKTSSG